MKGFERDFSTGCALSAFFSGVLERLARGERLSKLKREGIGAI